MLDGSSRRNILKLMAASFGLAASPRAASLCEHILPNSKGIEDYVPGQAYFYATAMPLGGSVQGLLVETHDGRPTKIEGNPDHPYSLGAASSYQQASILNLYDPDRLKEVTAAGKKSSWDEYTKWAGGHFASLRRRFEGTFPERDDLFAHARRGAEIGAGEDAEGQVGGVRARERGQRGGRCATRVRTGAGRTSAVR